MESQLTAPVRVPPREVRPPVAENPGADPFPVRAPSERETQIICLAALGLTNVEAARRLHISRHTVAQHLSQIMHECGARSRCELVARAYAAGILASWPPRRISDAAREPGSRYPAGSAGHAGSGTAHLATITSGEQPRAHEDHNLMTSSG